MTKRFLGFHQAMYGDIAMSTVAARILKKIEPDSHLTFIVGGDYAGIMPLLHQAEGIDDIYITHSPKDGFDDYDLKWITTQGFTHVFNPMQDHDHRNPWFRHRNQPLETAHMHGLPTEGDDGKIRLVKWFPVPDLRDYVAISPFPAWYAGINNDKALTIERAQAVVDFVLSKGFKVLQVGHRDEPKLVGTVKHDTSYYDSVRNVLGCKGMVMGDSGLNWVLSGYDFPVVAWYGSRYYGAEWVHNIQPINPNAAYIHGEEVNQIPLDTLLQLIQTQILDRS